MKPTLHLVYPHAEGVSAPDVIGRKLGEYLSGKYIVVLHEWDTFSRIRPRNGDVLIGHPHPLFGTTFRRSFGQQGWARRVVMSPFNGDAKQVAFLDPYVRHADAFLAITGAWWFDRVPYTEVSHWAPHMVHIDLAVDTQEFPRVKEEFSPAGRRRLLYIGHAGWQKNVSYLSQIALARPQWDFAWIGRGQGTDIPGVRHLGFRDTSLKHTQELIASFDFMVTVGRNDANPITILEALAWGLIPFCTRQSGYADVRGIVNLPLDDVDGALHILDGWQVAPNELLVDAQGEGTELLHQHYTWARFGKQVEEAIWANLAPTSRVSLRQIMHLKRVAAISPYSPVRSEGRRMLWSALRKSMRAHRT